MSDQDKLLGRLDVIEGNINDFIKSRGAEVEANKTGMAAVVAEIAEMRTMNQELAELAKRMDTTKDDTPEKKLGMFICKSARNELTRAASEGTDVDGGFLVEDEIVHTILSAQNKYGLVRQVYGTDIHPMKSDVTKVPVDTFEETSGNTPEPVATSENAAITESSDAQLDQVTLTAQKYATLNYISNELIDDAFVDYLGAFLFPKLARRAAKIEDSVVFNTASTGLLATANVLSENMGSGRDAFTDVENDDLIDMEDAVVDDALADGMYIMHRSILSLLRKLKGNDGHPILTPMSAGLPSTLNGYPWSTGSALVAKGSSAVSTGFILFGDPKLGSVFGERKERSIKTSEEFRFNQDQLAVRMTFRIALGTNSNIGQALVKLVTAAA